MYIPDTIYLYFRLSIISFIDERNFVPMPPPVEEVEEVIVGDSMVHYTTKPPTNGRSRSIILYKKIYVISEYIYIYIC